MQDDGCIDIPDCFNQSLFLICMQMLCSQVNWPFHVPMAFLIPALGEYSNSLKPLALRKNCLSRCMLVASYHDMFLSKCSVTNGIFFTRKRVAIEGSERTRQILTYNRSHLGEGGGSPCAGLNSTQVSHICTPKLERTAPLEHLAIPRDQKGCVGTSEKRLWTNPRLWTT